MLWLRGGVTLRVHPGKHQAKKEFTSLTTLHCHLLNGGEKHLRTERAAGAGGNKKEGGSLQAGKKRQLAGGRRALDSLRNNLVWAG